MKTRKHYRVMMPFVLLLVARAMPVFAQDVTATGELAPTEIPFHQVATYTIRVNAPVDAAVVVAPWAESMPGLAVQRGESHSRVLGGGRQAFTQVFHLVPSRVARYELPAAQVQIAGKQVADVVPVVLEVRDLTEAERAAVAEPLPLLSLEEAQARMPHLPMSTLFIGGIVLLLAGTAMAGVLYVRRQRGPATPGQVAEMRVRELVGRLDKRRVRGEAYYVELSDILRDFVSERFRVHVHERSTPEVANALGVETVLSDPQVEAFVALLRSFDGVKFALRQPAISQMMEEADSVIAFIRDVDDLGETVEEPAEQESAA